MSFGPASNILFHLEGTESEYEEDYFSPKLDSIDPQYTAPQLQYSPKRESMDYKIEMNEDEGVCTLCLDEKTEDTFTVSLCNHSFCIECITHYVKIKVSDYSVQLGHKRVHVSLVDNTLKISHFGMRGILCPAFGCEGVIRFCHIRQLVGEEMWDKLNTRLFENYIENFKRERNAVRMCPFNCGGFLQEDCYCYRSACKERMKKIQRLKKLKEEEEARRRLERWKAQNTLSDALMAVYCKKHQLKTCQKCKQPIEKNGGCDHMYCTSCKTHFSWSRVETATNVWSNYNPDNLPPQIKKKIAKIKAN